MSSLITRSSDHTRSADHTRNAKPTRRVRSRVTAAVAAIGVSAAIVVATADPAQARARSCDNIAQSMIFFWLAMEDDTGVNAHYLAGDTRMYNLQVSLYRGAGC